MKIRVNEIPENIINTTIKPIDVKDSNAEIEKGEIVFNSQNMQLHKALGKRHSQGGTPVSLAEKSFIFSDFNKLSLSKKDKEQMEFKEGGSARGKNTPAKVLAREVDIKHHNTMLHILNSDKNDPIAKTTAQLMIQKNLEKIGQVAYKQEEKKRFKDDIPEFSKGTLPIYSDKLDDSMKKAEQYKEGGNFRYLPQYQDGKNNVRDKYKWFTDKWGKFVMPEDGKPYNPNQLPKGYNNLDYAKDYMTVMNESTGNNYPTTQAGWSQMRLDHEKNNPEYVQNAMQNNFINKNATTQFEYGDPTRPWYDGIGIEKDERVFNSDIDQLKWEQDNNFKRIPGQISGIGQANKGYYVHPETGRYMGARLRSNIPKVGSTTPTATLGNMPTTLRERPALATPAPAAAPAATDLPTIGKYPKIGFTDLQKLNYLSDVGNLLSLKRYDPMRQHKESITAAPVLQSVQPYLNQINQGYFNSSNLLKGVSNINQLSAATQQLYGDRLDQGDKAIGQVQNQNNQTLNGWKQNAAAQLNADADQNRKFDADYYDKSIVSRQNYDNAFDIGRLNIKNNYNADMSKLAEVNSYYRSQPLVRTTIPVKDKGNIIGYRGELPIMPRKTFSSYINEYNNNIDPEVLKTYNAGITGQNTESQLATYKLLAQIDNEISALSGDTSKEAAEKMKGLVLYSESLRKRLNGK